MPRSIVSVPPAQERCTGAIYQDMLSVYERLSAQISDPRQALRPVLLARRWMLIEAIEKILYQRASWPEAQRRMYLRVPSLVGASFLEQGVWHRCMASEIGERGLFVSTTLPPREGTGLAVQLHLGAGGQPLELRAEVAWVSHHPDPSLNGMGLRFTDLSASQDDAIRRLMRVSVDSRLAERRHATRVDCSGAGHFQCRDGRFDLAIENLSISGLLASVTQALPPGRQGTLQLGLPDRPGTLSCPARVARFLGRLSSEPFPRIALELIAPPAAVRRTLLDFITRRATGFGRQPDGELASRTMPRIRRRILLRLVTREADRYAVCGNLSASGLFIQTFDPPPIGTELGIQIEHPACASELHLRGLVIREVRPGFSKLAPQPGFGVQLIEMAPSIRTLWLDMLEAWCQT